jgi:hypothetical protein
MPFSSFHFISQFYFCTLLDRLDDDVSAALTLREKLNLKDLAIS